VTDSLPSTQRLSTQFARLHPAIQRWACDQGWRRLRDVQERAIAPILAADRDVILAAATASGKTEAAWLPIGSAVMQEPASPGVAALYVAPLKALINDQHERLTALFGDHGVAVHRWHGDVPQSQKQQLLRTPSGVLLITPESLEAVFVNLCGSQTRSCRASWDFVFSRRGQRGMALRLPGGRSARRGR
jgi:ATP-dependent Lhr-like helicase